MPDSRSGENKTSLRDRVKDKFLSPNSSIRLPKFMTNEPASPAKYDGVPISPGYITPLDAVSSRKREEWYVPPPAPMSPPRSAPHTPHGHDRKVRRKRACRSQDGPPPTSPEHQDASPSPQDGGFSWQNTPRGYSSTGEYFPQMPDPLNESPAIQPL